MTISDFRDGMADISKILHEKGAKEFYLISEIRRKVDEEMREKFGDYMND